MNNGLVSGLTAGKSAITYTVTNLNGCITTVTDTVTVNALPVLTPISGKTSLCLNQSATLSSTPTGGVWNSSNVNITSINSAGVITGIAPGMDTITYTFTNTNGCVSSVLINDTVNAIPVVASITGTNTVCAGKTTQLSETTNGGTWNTGNSSVATVNNGLVSGLSAGKTAINYTVTNSNGCSTTVTDTVTVNALPIVASITGTNTICAGKTTQLSETTTGGTWNTSNSSVATVNNGLVSGLTAGKSAITYTVTNVSGCVTTVTDTVTVYALTILTPISGKTSICLNQTATLSSTPTGGVWNSSNVNITSINSTGLISGIAPGMDTITYTYTNSNGCISSVTINDTVNALPIVALITGTNTLCVGKTTQLSETTIGGTWNTSNLSVATVNNGLISGLIAGKSAITYTITNISGCTTTVTDTVTVNALPVLTPISGKTSICLNQTATLSSTPTGGAWSSSNVNITSVNSAGLITGVAPGMDTITYTYTNSNGCVSSVTINDTVNAIPVVAPVTGINIICVGNTTQLSDITSGGTWNTSNSTVATVNNGFISGLSAGKTAITYSVTNTNGCSTTVTDTVTVNALPILNSITGISSVCVGSTLNPANSTSNGKWTLTNNILASIDSITGTIKALSAGTDTAIYTVTNISGCTSSVSSSFVINSVPVITSIGSNSPINTGDTLYLTSASSVTGVVYSWSGPGGFTSGIQNPGIISASLTNAGMYYVSANNNGCISLLDSTSVTVNTSYFVNGNITTPKGYSVTGASINVTGSSVKSTTTDANGNYDVQLGSGVNTNYYLTPGKNNDVTKANGVTSLDVALVQAHILQKSILNSPYKIIAADVNGDGKVTAIDIVYMKRLILAYDTTFPGSKLWGFVDSSYIFQSPTSPFPYANADTITGLSANTTGKSFVGFKLGDVNWDWSPALGKGTIFNNSSVEINYPTTTVDDNGLVKIPIRAKNIRSMIGMQFTLNYNKEVFDFVQIKNNQLNFDFADHNDAGSLSFIWNDPNNIICNLDDNTVLFEIVLSKKANFDTEDISINSSITKTEAVDENYLQHDVVKTSGLILNKTISSVNAEYVNVGPNPSNGMFNVVIGSNLHKSVKLSIVDVNGKLLFVQKYDLIQGKNTISFDITKRINSSSGNYFLIIDDEKTVNSYKILINQ